MRRKFSLVLTLAAWLLVTGSQWDLVQTFAWSRMVATYAQSMSVTQAVKKTFDGELCDICVVVQDAKQGHGPDHTPAPENKLSEKILFVGSPDAPWVASPALLCTGLPADVSAPLSAERCAPPSPPPRAFA